ncbi:MAG TPA: DUF1269 domain-containing protein [Anaerolineales bacterium]|nr:DUF1269 domain-containing protein [Anaerolineales bacterium]
MSDLFVLAFDDPKGANEMLGAIQDLQKQLLIKVDDAAIVNRQEDGKVKIKQAVSLVGAGALGGAFWGMLIGLLFFMPWLGLAIGAITGAISGKLSDYGIDDDFIKEVGSTIEPGNSALFLMIRSMTEDKVMEELKKYDAKVVRTSLSKEDEAKLRAAFGAEEEESPAV